MLRKVKFYLLLRVCGVGSAARQMPTHIIRFGCWILFIIAYKGNMTGKGKRGDLRFLLNCECECWDATLLS